jgi:hypothetical protein
MGLRDKRPEGSLESLLTGLAPFTFRLNRLFSLSTVHGSYDHQGGLEEYLDARVHLPGL